MAHIYIAFVDTPGLFGSLIRKYLKQRYVHLVISGDADLTEAYSVGRRNPAVPVIAGFEKEDKVKILHRFPTAFYRVCELSCTLKRKQKIMERLRADYQRRFQIHYAGCGRFLKDRYRKLCRRVLTVHGRVLPPMKKGNRQKWIVHIGSFAAVMVLTFWRVFRNQDFAGMAASIRKLSMLSVAEAVFLAVAFVAGEGCMIWYLLKGIGEKTSLRRCISYSFIGFFFSGITPSATGGQPMQLYYMRKDGSALSSASVVLMTVAVLYKFVLALTGIGILLFGRQSLKSYFQGYGLLYLLGLFLNIAVVAALILVMFSPEIIKAAFFKTERLLLYLKLWKKIGTEKK